MPEGVPFELFSETAMSAAAAEADALVMRLSLAAPAPGTMGAGFFAPGEAAGDVAASSTSASCFEAGELERNDEDCPLHSDGDTLNNLLTGISLTGRRNGVTSTHVIAGVSSSLLCFDTVLGGEGTTAVLRLARVTGIFSSLMGPDEACIGVVDKGAQGPTSLVTAAALAWFLAALLLLGGPEARKGEMGSFDSKALAFSCTLHLVYGEKSCLDGVAARLAGE